MTHIQYQKKLMEAAIVKLNEIDLLWNILRLGDPVFYKVVSAELKKGYADIMADLKIELDGIKEECEYHTLFRQFYFHKN